MQARKRILNAGHDAWRADRRLPTGQWPGMRYVLLHTFAHAMVRELALECGYSAAGIAERVYARSGDPRDRRVLYGAACHACLFAAETSCERGDHYLDRRLLVDTVVGTDAAFLPQ